MLLVLGATASAILALAPGSALDDLGHLLGPTPASARTLLVRAATEIQHRPWHPLAPGQYFYFREEIGYHAPGTPGLKTSTTQGWVAASGFMRLVEKGSGPPEVLLYHPDRAQVMAERRRQERAGHAHVEISKFAASWSGLSYRQLVRLPRDPSRLRSWIIEHTTGGGPRDATILQFALEMIEGAPLPPRLTSSFYRVLAQLPEMRAEGAARDSLGRLGVAVAFDGSHPAHLELIFDSRTGALLGVRGVSPNGRLDSWQAFAQQGIVRGDTQTPDHGGA